MVKVRGKMKKICNADHGSWSTPMTLHLQVPDKIQEDDRVVDRVGEWAIGESWSRTIQMKPRVPDKMKEGDAQRDRGVEYRARDGVLCPWHVE